MEKTMKLAKSSELYRNINVLKLSPSERSEALGALALAETIVGAFECVAKWISGATATSVATPHPKLKHQ